MSREGGFKTYWLARSRLLLEGATPWEEVATTAIPLDRWVDVEVVACERHPVATFLVSDSSGRTHRAKATADLYYRIGDRGRFRRRLAPGSPRVLRLKGEAGFAAVTPEGAIVKEARNATELLHLVKEEVEFERRERGSSPR